MVFKNNETLASLYEGITKQIDPSTEQFTRQAPTLSNTDLSKDQDLLAEAYKTIGKKEACKPAAKGCDCDGCDECKANQKTKDLSPAQKKIAQAAPPPDKITGADFKALKKEGLNFKDMFAAVMTKKKSA